MSSSRPDTAATNRDDVDSEENINNKFMWAREATTYDNLLLDGRISNANVREYGGSGLHRIPHTGRWNKGIDTDMLLYYLLTCDPPADVNGRDWGGRTPMWAAAEYKINTSAVKVLIDFGGDRTIKSNSDSYYNSNMTPLDIAKAKNNQGSITMLTECFLSEE